MQDAPFLVKFGHYVDEKCTLYSMIAGEARGRELRVRGELPSNKTNFLTNDLQNILLSFGLLSLHEPLPFSSLTVQLSLGHSLSPLSGLSLGPQGWVRLEMLSLIILKNCFLSTVQRQTLQRY